MKIFNYLLVLTFSLFLISCEESNSGEKPTVYMIGDSTVKNGQGDGADGLWGWGDHLRPYFDTTQVNVVNHALGGTSSRTFRDKGLWEPVRDSLKKGDYVLIQFGHNDAGPLNDNHRARGTIQGTGNDSEEIDNILTGKHEIVHSYGWYIRKYIKETRGKGAVPVIMSPIPRNDWINGKVRRNADSYGGWAKQVATEENTFFIDLNDSIARKYEELGHRDVEKFFPEDHTHTNIDGAKLNALIVTKSLHYLKNSKLRSYISLPEE